MPVPCPYISPTSKERKFKNTTNAFPAEKFISHNVTDSVENISDHVVQYDVVSVMKVLFKDSISSKEFFENNELTTLVGSAPGGYTRKAPLPVIRTRTGSRSERDAAGAHACVMRAGTLSIPNAWDTGNTN